MITTKTGISLLAGGLLTAGLAFALSKRRSGRVAAAATAPGTHRTGSRPKRVARADTYKPRPLEVSSLVGAHGLAPDRELMGEPLADPEIVEVPVGLSADRAYDGQLQHDKLPQPDTTGAILKPPSESTQGMFIEHSALERPLDAEFDDRLQDFDGGVSAQPAEHYLDSNEGRDGYDAVSPDELGAEFLSRATEAPRTDAELVGPWDLERMSDEDLGADGGAALGEGNRNAWRSPDDGSAFGDEDGVFGDDDEPLSIQVEVEVPREIWDVGPQSQR